MYARVENVFFMNVSDGKIHVFFSYFRNYFEVITLIKQRVKPLSLDEQKLITCVRVFQLDKYSSQNIQLHIVYVPCYSLMVLCFK